MSDTRQVIPITGLAVTVAFAACMVARMHAQTTVLSGNFTNAGVAEVQDAQGQVLLRGQFATSDEQDEDDVERKAVLKPAGADDDAVGEAEVEFAKTTPDQQEIEFSAQNLAAGTSVTFLIDGQVIGTAATDRRGRAELELELPSR